eukprot:CAMPEP_0206443516 /NCGR_PEP_ID=MMETSP0324_2-20121206/14408_1 /ASSEMBLY_ACC=CAM_ASM_000836 /TAXON_ID=2866 /ORGANISM="Crypthecodinium cohnii, Strain Seligo" /LENGTH=411 /DNA_ID=CAMNT_0053911453 /DNA_START=106 /DNA_END=1341 /DNA_ORIENTATION=+
MAQIWEIVGGADKGGILVRSGPATTDAQKEERLSTGALVEEIALQKDRLHYKLLEGTGPADGWIAIKITAKDLAIRTDKKPKASATSAAPTKVGPRDEEPLPIALFFPGQGSQYVKMLDGVKSIPQVQEMLKTAEGILGYDLLALCLEGPEDKLSETRYCQPAMFVGGLAAVEKLRIDNAAAVERCAVMAGLSLGEYTALCAAGVFSFEDGLTLVKLRGEAMQEAASVGEQLMLSVAGLEKAKLVPLCEKFRAEDGKDGVCQIANELFPNGFAVGGTKKAIEALRPAVEAAGALQAKVLKTSGAFHTPLMQPAQDKLSAALEEMLPRMKSPKHTVWMNASAEPMRPGCQPEEIVALLKKQLTNPVLWEPSLRKIMDEGVKEFYECGPMKQIKAMMKRIDATAWKATTNVEV